MNAAATKGYEKDVGVKTTFQTLYSRIANSYQKPNKILVIPTGTREIHFAGRAPSILKANSSDVRSNVIIYLFRNVFFRRFI